MPSPATNTRATLIPCLRYRDASAAIDWLCKAFGFKKMLVVPEGTGRIAHAELVIDIKDGGRGFTCRDLEEHDWTFGSYDPW